MTTPASAPSRPAMFVLSTPEPARVTDFYRLVIGWELQPMAAFPSGGRVGALGQAFVVRQGEVGWLPFLPVTDLAELLARARGAGAKKVVFPLPDDDIGCSAAVIDPTGARLGLLQFEWARQPDREPLGSGRVVWIEEKTDDPDAAAAFHLAVFGLGSSGAAQVGRPQSLRGDGAPPYSGIAALEEGWGRDYPPRWLPYVSVNDLDRTLADAAEHGGSAWLGRTDTDLGAVAYVRDPDDNVLALVELSESGRALLTARPGQARPELAGRSAQP